jgi:hypothetical protein
MGGVNAAASSGLSNSIATLSRVPGWVMRAMSASRRPAKATLLCSRARVPAHTCTRGTSVRSSTGPPCSSATSIKAQRSPSTTMREAGALLGHALHAISPQVENWR